MKNNIFPINFSLRAVLRISTTLNWWTHVSSKMTHEGVEGPTDNANTMPRNLFSRIHLTRRNAHTTIFLKVENSGAEYPSTLDACRLAANQY